MFWILKLFYSPSFPIMSSNAWSLSMVSAVRCLLPKFCKGHKHHWWFDLRKRATERRVWQAPGVRAGGRANGWRYSSCRGAAEGRLPQSREKPNLISPPAVPADRCRSLFYCPAVRRTGVFTLIPSSILIRYHLIIYTRYLTLSDCYDSLAFLNCIVAFDIKLLTQCLTCMNLFKDICGKMCGKLSTGMLSTSSSSLI